MGQNYYLASIRPAPDIRTRTSMLSWAILLLLAAGFLLLTYLIAR